MKRIIRNFLALMTFGVILASCTTKEVSCTLKGRIHDRNSDTLILIRATDDPRFNQVFIPVRDSAFEFTLKILRPEAYELIYKEELDRGSWRPVLFIAEKGEIKFELYGNPDENIIFGKKLNNSLNEYNRLFLDTFRPRMYPLNDSMDALFEKDEYYSEEMKLLRSELAESKDNENRIALRNKMAELQSSGNDLSPEARKIARQGDRIKAEATRWRYDYIRENPSIVSYYFLLDDLKSGQASIAETKSLYPAFADMYPEHTYTEIVKNLLEGYEAIKTGGSYVDFSLPDLEGNFHSLSDIIGGKYALIDLWASWCGPCIATSRSMIPVYEEFKDRGFTVCGVAAEIDNTDQMRARIEKEKFPWINLVELDHRNHIWDKYRVSNSGGGTFLVDREGVILAINPDADEVRKILSERLNQTL
jgi:thiol-disulfide isomerase/thioredoxin